MSLTAIPNGKGRGSCDLAKGRIKTNPTSRVDQLACHPKKILGSHPVDVGKIENRIGKTERQKPIQYVDMIQSRKYRRITLDVSLVLSKVKEE